MMMRYLSRVLLLILLLSGCGNQGAGVTTDSQASRETQQSSQVARTQTLTSEQQHVALVTVPVSPLIGEAWRELVRLEKDLPKESACEKLWSTPFSAFDAAQGNPETALLCAFMLGHRYAFMPTMGWTMEPKSPQGSFYMLRVLAYVLHVNNLASDIAAQVAMRSYPTLEDAKTEIKTLLLAQRPYLMQAYTASMNLQLLGVNTIDLANAKDVMFARGPYHITLGANGALIKYSGVDWFGNGNLSGKRYELQLASMTGVSMTKGKTVTDSGGQQVGASEKAQAGVGK